MILDSLVSKINRLGINDFNGGFVYDGDANYIYAERRESNLQPLTCVGSVIIDAMAVRIM